MAGTKRKGGDGEERHWMYNTDVEPRVLRDRLDGDYTGKGPRVAS